MKTGKARELVVVLSAILLPLVIIGGVWLATRGRGTSAAHAAAGEACRDGLLKLVQSASSPISITLWSTQGHKSIDRASADLDEVLGTYAKKSDGKLSYRWRKIVGPEERSAAQSEGLQPLLMDTADPAAPVQEGYLGISLAYGSERASIPVLMPDAVDAMPFWLANKIRELMANADHKSVEVAVLSGMDELGLGDPNLVPRNVGATGPSIKSILNQSFPFYALRDVPVSSQVSALENFPTLVVTQPGRTLTDLELRLIDDYVMLGGRTLIVIASAVNLTQADANMLATLDRRGLDRLLGGYGIELGQDLVFDPGSGVEITTDIGKKVAFPALPVAKQLAADFPAFFRLDAVAFPASSSLVLHPERQPNAKLRAVARTSDRAVSSSEQGQRMGPGFAVPAGGGSERILAAVASGELKSAFGDRRAKGRVLVIGSSLFPTNPFARAVNKKIPDQPAMGAAGDPTVTHLAQAYAQRHLTSTILVVKSALDWATADERVIACSLLLVNRPEPVKKQ